MRSATVIDVTEQTFEHEVLQRSESVPVVVDFWAAWCGPCRVLGPLLERLAEEAAGEWVLAKVDVDSNPTLAARYGVQGIPAVHAFRGGREVSRFVGALPEAQVRHFLGALGPGPADHAVDEGRDAESRGDLAAAAEAYRRALAHEPARHEAKAALARVELALRSGGVDEATLRARAEADPADIDAVTGLADLEMARGDAERALARLLDAVRRTSGDERERARLHLLGLLDTLPSDDPRALAARRALANALY